jgi:hypothetical protein
MWYAYRNELSTNIVKYMMRMMIFPVIGRILATQGAKEGPWQVRELIEQLH